MASKPKTQYNDHAHAYSGYDDLPMARLEGQLIRTALGDCSGLRVLDLGGGSGTHARQALAAGAARVDVVDVSHGMMEQGRKIEEREGRGGADSPIRWFEGDATLPLWEQDGCRDLLPAGQYDVALGNWLLDHALTVADLEAMWRNLAACLKPGGRFIGIRVNRPAMKAAFFREGRYGVRAYDFSDIPDGVLFNVDFLCEPPVKIEVTSMEDSYGLVDDIPRRLGLVDFQTVPLEEAPMVKQDREHWKAFIDEPVYVVVTARKG